MPNQPKQGESQGGQHPGGTPHQGGQHGGQKPAESPKRDDQSQKK